MLRQNLLAVLLTLFFGRTPLTAGGNDVHSMDFNGAGKADIAVFRPVPAEIGQLQQERTALLVQHISFTNIHPPEPVAGTTGGKPSFAVNP
jgi:hypothetical protein